MRKPVIGVLVLAAGQFVLSPGQASQRQDEAGASVAVLQAKGGPEGQLQVPVELTPGKGAELGSLAMTVRFPLTLVSFLRIELGGVAEGVGAEAEAAVETDPQEQDRGLVHLTIATPERDGRRAALPEGRVAGLWFKIAKDAKPETVIPLTVVTATGAGTKAGAGALELDTRDGEILVSKLIITSCFFYMH